MMCSRIHPIVNGLKEAYGDKMAFEIVPFNTTEAEIRIIRYGMDLHGMVITDQNDKVKWIESGHRQKRGTVESAIKKLLGA